MFLKSYDEFYPENLRTQCNANNRMIISGDSEQAVWVIDWDKNKNIKQVEKTTAYDAKDAVLVKYDAEVPIEMNVIDYSKISIAQKNKRPSFSSSSWPLTVIKGNEKNISEFVVNRISVAQRNISLRSPFIITAQKCCSGTGDDEFCAKLKQKPKGGTLNNSDQQNR